MDILIYTIAPVTDTCKGDYDPHKDWKNQNSLAVSCAVELGTVSHRAVTP